MSKRPQPQPLTEEEHRAGAEEIRQLERERLATRRFVRTLQRAQEAVADLIPLFPDQTTDDPELGLVTAAAEALQQLQDLAKGAEPAWMQDIRIAQRKLDAARIASHSSPAAQSDRPSE